MATGETILANEIKPDNIITTLFEHAIVDMSLARLFFGHERTDAPKFDKEEIQLTIFTEGDISIATTSNMYATPINVRESYNKSKISFVPATVLEKASITPHEQHLVDIRQSVKDNMTPDMVKKIQSFMNPAYILQRRRALLQLKQASKMLTEGKITFHDGEIDINNKINVLPAGNMWSDAKFNIFNWITETIDSEFKQADKPNVIVLDKLASELLKKQARYSNSQDGLERANLYVPSSYEEVQKRNISDKLTFLGTHIEKNIDIYTSTGVYYEDDGAEKAILDNNTCIFGRKFSKGLTASAGFFYGALPSVTAEDNFLSADLIAGYERMWTSVNSIKTIGSVTLLSRFAPVITHTKRFKSYRVA